MSNSIPAKDVVYIDVDDEITTIIDKVRSSQSKILALVLPKRSATLQSVVNMKLLKRSADTAGKHLVLITTEAGLMPLAANVGLYVAKNLQTKPEVPDMPHAIAELPDDLEESLMLDDPAAKTVKPSLDGSRAVGDLARGSMPPSALDDAIDLDNSSPNPIMRHNSATTPVVGGASGLQAPKTKKNRKLNVPNFDKFRMWLIFGGGGLVLIIFLWVMCFKVLPKASILVKTNSTAVAANLNVTLNTSTSSVNTDGGVVPAQSQQTQKTLTAQADSTGQQNNGQKASGIVTLSSQVCGSIPSGLPADVPAGTGVTANNLTFITQSDTVFQNGPPKHGCITFTATTTTAVTAQKGGAQYNLAAGNFTVAGRSDVSASSSDAFTGGTDQITKILQQSDIDTAKQKLAAQDTSAVKQQLQNQLTNMGLYPVAATFVASTPNITTSANAGDTVDNVTVTENLTYTMLGAKQSDFEKLIASAVNAQIDTSKQTILDYGMANASFTAQSADNGTVTMHVTAVAGPDLKIAALRQAVAGKKTGDATSIIKSNPGVTNVTITYSPFWVSSIPGSQSKINITIDKPQTQVNASN
ncbi:MAG: hypothetical protein ACQR33_05590 [Candidatus Saccharibacteria bacterium]